MENLPNQKIPHDIDVMLERIESAVASFPKAAMFELAEDGYTSAFEQLVSCILSIRTLDEVSLEVARSLFRQARTPAEIMALPVVEIDRLIHASTFHERKADQIHNIAEIVATGYQGVLPCDEQLILSFPGVGIKCANLTLGIACGAQKISVDVHVHRITNRWGYVHTSSPEATTQVLEQKLPPRHWLNINRLLVPFGKHICTGRLPQCSTCPVLRMCWQVGVEKHR